MKGWFLKAEMDFGVVLQELRLKEKKRIAEAICFHSQQCAEKYLKGFLVSRIVPFGKTHNIEFLLQLCEKEDSSFSKLGAGDLTEYSVEVRYPEPYRIPSPFEVAGA